MHSLSSLSGSYLADENKVITSLAAHASLDNAQNKKAERRAADWVAGVRAKTSAQNGVIDAFLQEYGLSTKEGIILMRLSEALIRTPDFATAQELMRDKLGAGKWADHAGGSPAALINGATMGLRISSAWINATGGTAAQNLAAKLGDRVLHTAIVRGMGVMADHFVLGSTIEAAIARGKKDEVNGVFHSFDMLGEAARTQADADRYFVSYLHAAQCLAQSSSASSSVATSPGLSVKLSALHPRYEYANREECVPILADKVKTLALIAKADGIGLTLDAEEADRLEISLLIFDALLRDPDLNDWDGLGIVVQAYQRRARDVITHLVDAAQSAGRKIAIRLVKGAYWDAEIKRAQEMGLESYPVFTRKEHTDISYLACARQLLAAGNAVYPQFATHNAHTASVILEMAGGNSHMEFQRLHGMGAPLHAEIIAETGVRSRVYAPVGNHKELLPYLVRRLLENGANSSFVNQLMNPDVAIDDIVRDPLTAAQAHNFERNTAIPAPRDTLNGERLSAIGMDLTQANIAAQAEAYLPLPHPILAASIIAGKYDSARAQAAGVPITNPANIAQIVGYIVSANAPDVDSAIASAIASKWGSTTSAADRGTVLMRMADLLEENMPALMALCVAEAGKSLPDAVAEIREAVDFCRYYAGQAVLPRLSARKPVGVTACISPWNFPLAIFTGQVAAALAAGNTVVAKPAAQTPLIAFEAVKLFHQAGVHTDALHLLIGGPDIGAMVTGHKDVRAVCFTGSTPTAQRIAALRADIGCADTPFIAETGGINAMIVDSTALLEQAVNDAVDAAFQSAGQRCSACRIVCVQEEIADDFESMLAGSMQLLQLGNPALLATDIGPIIDAQASQRITDYCTQMASNHRVIARAPMPHENTGHFVQPVAIAVKKVSDVRQEVFGPVLHVVRFKAEKIDDLIDEINALGFGLTLGLHTRIDARIQSVCSRAKVGNIYANRNQIGAVVGVQPFGGEGLSGTGPKAGGPHYLLRLSMPGDPVTHPGKHAVWENSMHGAFISEAAAAMHLTSEQHRVLDTFALQTKIILPGPTGEENTLSLHPRGTILVCGGDGPDDRMMQCLAVLASGNRVIIAAQSLPIADRLAPLHAVIANASMPADTMTIVDADSVPALLQGNIDGVIADGTIREDIAVQISQRAAAMIPLLSLNDYPERFFHERTLTVNTTAAGGNATLLMM